MKAFQRSATELSVTARLDRALLKKLDAIAAQTDRSRADAVRHLIRGAQLTGNTDLDFRPVVGSEDAK